MNALYGKMFVSNQDNYDQPKYSKNWFRKENFKKYLDATPGMEKQYLEIGAFEGLSANYFVDNYLQHEGSKITCIDPWIKYSESTLTGMTDWDEWINESSYNIFIKNIEKNKSKIIINRGLSKDILPTLNGKYDFIYIDGDHSTEAVWLDGVMSFPLLKLNGILIFDDYNFSEGERSPKAAIDRFLIEYNEKLELLEINRQVIIKKSIFKYLSSSNEMHV